MNRIQHLIGNLESSLATLPVTSSISPSSTHHAASHCLFAPLHYEPNYAYPLLVWLHGPGDDQRQLRRVMPLISMRNYVGVAPRGTVGAPEDPAQRGLDWRQDEEHILLAEQRVLSAIRMAGRKFHVEPSRIFLAGFASGGTMALRIALNHPHRFAGALSLGGAFPSGLRPLARLAEVRRLQLFLATARDSDRYPPRQVCENLRLFHAAGLAVNLRQYPCGDELTTNMLSDMDRWIMDQLTAPAVAHQSAR